MRRRRHGARATAVLPALVLTLALLLAPAASAAPAASPPRVEAKAWIVVDGRSGDVLASHAAERHLPIASTTKMMTAFVAMHELPLDKIVRAAPYEPIYGESLLGLKTGERVSVRDLLYGLILVSGNDAAHTLAVRAAGSQARFVAQMNRHAAALGLSDTHYANPVGLDQRGNYSSAADLATLARRLLAMPAFAKIADSRTALLRSLRPPRRIETLNELLDVAPWATGVKTGHTFDAGYVLVGSGRRDGVELVSAAIGAPTEETRTSDNLELLEWGFSQYRQRFPVRRGQDLAEPEIRWSGGQLPLRPERSLQVGVRRGQQLDLRVRAPRQVEGPIQRGAKLGQAVVFVDGRRVGAVSLRASRSVSEASLFDRARATVADNSLPIGIAAFVILIFALVLVRQLTRRHDSGSRSRVKAE
jgi:serine-type D-Ala-D-Ala carboxypeptidase (penicillin-binding protein 5/6)